MSLLEINTMKKISKKFILRIGIIILLLAGGFLAALFQNDIIKIKADAWPIIVNTGHLEFGLVFPGEQAEKNFVVTYDGDGESVPYKIIEKYKPLPGAEVPDGYNGSISDYCQDHPDNFDKCYRNLCPYIIEYSNEEEGDVVTNALIGVGDDDSDTWIVHLNTPAIAGNISQDHTGGIVSANGEYGCDLSVDIEIPLRYSISGCKYDDANNNGVVDEGEEKLSGWEIQLISCPYAPLAAGDSEFLPKSRINTNPGQGESGYCSVIKTTTTDETGCYSFTGLAAGDYGVNEASREHWTQTVPTDNKFYYFNLGAGGNKTEINFANFTDYQEPYCGDGNLDPGEECDDGNKISGDGCSASCEKENGGGGGGGGGGGTLVSLQINNAKDCVPTEGGAYFSWMTNMKSSSRVVCDTEPHPDWGTPPDYGYTFFTKEYDKNIKVMNHKVEIPGLIPGESYYCRVVSSDSSATVFKEVICSIPGDKPEEKEEKKGEVKGANDVVIPKALPRTGFGSVKSW